MEAEYEVQRTMELTAFLCLLRKVCGPIKVHVDNKGIFDGLRKAESKCIKPRARDADLWINISEEPHELLKRGILVEVEHVKAHRTKKEKEKLTQFERFVPGGNEKADELAKAGAMLDEGFMAEARAETMKLEREEVYVALQYAACFHCLVEEWKDCEELKPKLKEKWSFIDRKSEGMKHRTEWCAEADGYRCVRCGRGSTYMKMPGRCTGPKFLSKSLRKWRRRHLRGDDLVRRMDRQGVVLKRCRKCSGYARQRMGPKLVNCCKLEQMGTKEFGKMMKRLQILEEGRVPAKEAKNWRIEGEKKRTTRKGVSEAVTQFFKWKV